MQLTQRKLLILQAIIDDYILTGIPVGSRTLSKREDMHLSSATIRNEMADLEEGGYLEQPHTSAGRMPSDKAYRLYVDTLMRVSKLNENEMRYINGYFGAKMGEIEQVIATTARVLSDTTNLTSVVLPPQLAKIEINRIQIVRLTGQRALLLFVFNTGMVKDVFINISEDLDNSYLEMVSNLLTDKVRNLTLHEAVSAVRGVLAGDMAAHRQFVESLLDAVRTNAQGQSAKEVVLGGAQNIFNHPEYRDVDKAKNFLQLLETREPLFELLSQATDMEFTIRIGKENDIDELKDMSVVTATYKVGGRSLGSFGVIGPTRMNYARVLSVLNFVGSSMNEILKCFLTGDTGE